MAEGKKFPFAEEVKLPAELEGWEEMYPVSVCSARTERNGRKGISGFRIRFMHRSPSIPSMISSRRHGRSPCPSTPPGFFAYRRPRASPSGCWAATCTSRPSSRRRRRSSGRRRSSSASGSPLSLRITTSCGTLDQQVSEAGQGTRGDQGAERSAQVRARFRGIP